MSGNSRVVDIARLALLLVGTLAGRAVGAYAFEPSDADFSSWPPYCQARYVGTVIGSTSRFVTKVDPGMQSAAEAALGAQTYLHVHHYCAGLIHFAKSRLEPDPVRRRYLLDEARAEMLFSLRSDPGTGPFYSTMVVNLALVERSRGEAAAARELLEGAIKSRPSDPKLYLGLAIILRGENKLKEAREVAEKGLESAGEESLELNYNLGLICFELADYDCALRHARVAYGADYPLTALKNRLEDRGLWKDD